MFLFPCTFMQWFPFIYSSSEYNCHRSLHTTCHLTETRLRLLDFPTKGKKLKANTKEQLVSSRFKTCGNYRKKLSKTQIKMFSFQIALVNTKPSTSSMNLLEYFPSPSWLIMASLHYKLSPPRINSHGRVSFLCLATAPLACANRSEELQSVG